MIAVATYQLPPVTPFWAGLRTGSGVFVIHQRHRTRLSLYLEGKTATFYHIWGCNILAIGAGMDVYLTGLWLPRAGAVVAGVAAWLYFFDPRTTDDWWMIRRASLPKHLKNPLAETPFASSSLPPLILGEKRPTPAQIQQARDQAEVAKMLSDLAERRHISYQAAKRLVQHEHDNALRAQAFWLFVGTLIWAFGDIPVELLKCGSVPC